MAPPAPNDNDPPVSESRHLLPRPKRQPKTFYVFAALSAATAVGAIIRAADGDWASAAGQAVVCILLASVPIRLSR